MEVAIKDGGSRANLQVIQSRRSVDLGGSARSTDIGGCASGKPDSKRYQSGRQIMEAHIPGYVSPLRRDIGSPYDLSDKELTCIGRS